MRITTSDSLSKYVLVGAAKPLNGIVTNLARPRIVAKRSSVVRAPMKGTKPDQ